MKSKILFLSFHISIFYFGFMQTVNAQKINAFEYKVVKHTTSKKGMVVCAHPLASKIGVMIMQKGGNAVDAIIATQLALAVVYPVAGNLGGGAFCIIRFANGTTKVLDYREVAPALASRNMYLDKNGNVIKNLSIFGVKASGVPGTVAGLFASMQFAKLPFIDLIQPAIELAQNGFAITKKEANMLNLYAPEFKKYNKHCSFFNPKNTKWKKGDTLIQKDLAQTLMRIQQNGEREFYEGKTAELIVKSMKNSKGLIGFDDLKNYKIRSHKPLIFDYKKDYTIISMPPPSSGGFVLQQILQMVEKKSFTDTTILNAQNVQLIVEAERRSFADRAKYLGDPKFVNIPLQKLLTRSYLENRINENFILFKAGNSEKTKYGQPKESSETTHLSAVDEERNVVVVTTTLNGNYGSCVMVDSAGFLLNNEMDDFNLKSGSTNMYGAVGEEQNFIEPHKTMLSSMSPTIVLKNNQFYFSVGSPGGTRIPTSVLQTIINLIDFKKNPVEAVNTPRFHHQWLPDEVDVEEDFPKMAKKKLIKMGYKINKKKSFGKVELIINNEQNELEGVGDKRGDDHAEGY